MMYYQLGKNKNKNQKPPKHVGVVKVKIAVRIQSSKVLFHQADDMYLELLQDMGALRAD